MSSIIKAPIPLKKVNVAKIFKNQNRGIRVKIKGVNFIGADHFLLKEDLALSKRKTLINRFIALEDVRTMKENTFSEYSVYDDYKCADNNIEYELREDFKPALIILKTEIGEVTLNYDYYSYFKALDVEFRFKSHVSAVGMFKDKEFVGVILPIRRVKNGQV